MATLKDIRGKKTSSALDLQRMPYLIVLKRTAIRIFPDGTKVALYYSDRLKRVFTVPFTEIGVTPDNAMMQHDT